MSVTENAAQLGLPASVDLLSAEVQVLRSYNQDLQDQNARLKHEIILLQRKLYGVRTEKMSTEEQQLLFAELGQAERSLQKMLTETDVARVEQQKVNAAADAKSSTSSKSPTAAPKGRRDLSQCNLPRIQVEIASALLEARGCKRVGVDISYELMARKASYAVLEKTTVRYGQNSPLSSATTVSAELPPRVYERSMFHESVIAKILAEKFGLGTTLYRLEKHLASQDFIIDRSTMSRMIEHVGNTLGITIVAAMMKHAKETAQVISTDATGVWIVPEPSQVKQPQSGRASRRCDKGHFFTVVADFDAVLFFYERDHTQKAVKQLFDGFCGYLQADASPVYHLLENGPPPDRDDDRDDGDANDKATGITLVGCFAHCRRYFFEAAQCRYPDGAAGLAHIAKIFAADKPLWNPGISAAERAAARSNTVAPLINTFFAWVALRKAALPMAQRNLISKALGYASNQEKELRRVLLDGNLPLDNTRSERALRTVVISRKNSLFHGSDAHAEATAAIFSLLQTCRLHGVDPQSYFEEVCKLLPQWPSDRFLELAPNFWKATRLRLVEHELASPLTWFSIPQKI